MKKIVAIMCAVVALSSSSELKAQSLKDLFGSSGVKDVVESVTGGIAVTQSSIAGEWNYKQPAMKLEGDNIMGNAAGAVATSEVEKKLTSICEKFGVKPGSFSFRVGSNNSFVYHLAGKEVTGSYTLDSKNSTIAFNFNAYGATILPSLTAEASLMGENLTLLFNADKLLAVVSKLSSLSKDGTLKMLNSSLKNFDSALLGIEFSRTAGTAEESTTESVANTIKGFFNR